VAVEDACVLSALFDYAFDDVLEHGGVCVGVGFGEDVLDSFVSHD
jgi:hypothetical protein